MNLLNEGFIIYTLLFEKNKSKTLEKPLSCQAWWGDSFRKNEHMQLCIKLQVARKETS